MDSKLRDDRCLRWALDRSILTGSYAISVSIRWLPGASGFATSLNKEAAIVELWVRRLFRLIMDWESQFKKRTWLIQNGWFFLYSQSADRKRLKFLFWAVEHLLAAAVLYFASYSLTGEHREMSFEEWKLAERWGREASCEVAKLLCNQFITIRRQCLKARLQIEVLYMIHRPSEFDADFEIEPMWSSSVQARRKCGRFKLASLVVAWYFRVGWVLTPGEFGRDGLSFKNLYQDSGQRIPLATLFLRPMFGKGVGVGTLINSGISFHPPDKIVNLGLKKPSFRIYA